MPYGQFSWNLGTSLKLPCSLALHLCVKPRVACHALKCTLLYLKDKVLTPYPFPKRLIPFCAQLMMNNLLLWCQHCLIILPTLLILCKAASCYAYLHTVRHDGLGSIFWRIYFQTFLYFSKVNPQKINFRWFVQKCEMIWFSSTQLQHFVLGARVHFVILISLMLQCVMKFIKPFGKGGTSVLKLC